MSTHVEQIKEKLGIVDVVGSYIELHKAGTNFKAKCPFHNEKSPSFFVSPGRNSYYCFGCAAKGDIFTFVQEFEGLDFVGALRVLAKRAGVELVRENPAIRTERERLYLTMEHATLFFERSLKVKPEALAYLKKRGLKEETIKDWRLGYASVDWRELFSYLQSKKISIEDMEKVGLVKKSEKPNSGSGYYDRFRGRIMFPIFDSSGRVVAFSGRQFESDGTEAKYINSPETPLFEKSKILYGFDRAKLNIRRQDFSLLVEGQMDLLMSHQAGFDNAVASSGTALTENHVDIIRRLSNNLVIAYDGDDAGGAAAVRGWQLALGRGMEVKIATLPEGKDPADIILENPKILTDAIANARHIIDVLLDKVMSKTLSDRERKVVVEKEILPYVAGLQSIAEQSHFISEIAFKIKMKDGDIWEIIKKISKNIAGKAVAPEVSAVPKNHKQKDAVARMLSGLLFWQKVAKPALLQDLDIHAKLCTIIGTDAVALLEQSFSLIRDDLIFEAETFFADIENSAVVRHLEDLAFNYKEESLRDAFAEAMYALQVAEREKDKAKALECIKRCQDLSLELRNIKQRS